MLLQIDHPVTNWSSCWQIAYRKIALNLQGWMLIQHNYMFPASCIHVLWITFVRLEKMTFVLATGRITSLYVEAYTLVSLMVDSHLTLTLTRTQLIALKYFIMINRHSIHTIHSIIYAQLYSSWLSSLRSKQKMFWACSTVSDSKIEGLGAWRELVTSRVSSSYAHDMRIDTVLV